MHLKQTQSLMFFAGASGMMIGDLLTTPNRSVQDDLDMLSELGLEAKVCGGKNSTPAISPPADQEKRTQLPVLQS